jgi:uncharacterized protein (DUF342 family)
MAKKDIRLQGEAELSISADKLSADIKFRKKKEGQEWSADELVALLSEAGIKHGFKEADVAEQLKIAGEKKDAEVVLKAARGDAPEHMKPEEPQYAQLDIPEDLMMAVPDKLEESPPPNIHKVIVDKIKKTKTVEKKPKLPFGKTKEETVEYTEDQTRREKVYVDPTVEAYGYVQAGSLIASILPSQPGSSGKDIYGETVQPIVIPDPYFYHGENTVKNGHEIRAEATGIVRKGTNWCDVVPFTNHDWSIELSDDKATCMLRFVPGDPLLEIPAYDQIVEQITGLDYPMDTIMPEGEIMALIRESVDTRLPINHKPISDSQDAHFEILVTEDKLKATLNVRKGRGDGQPLILKDLGKAIKDSGLVLSDREQLKADINEYYKSADLELRDYVLAEGVPPKEGPEQAVDWSARFLDEKEYLDLKKEIEEQRDLIEKNEDGSSFPLDQIDELAYVEAEQRIVTMGQAQKGEPGRDVYGNPVEGLMGKSLEFVLADQVEQKDNIIITTRAGLLEKAVVDDVVHLRVRPRRDSRINVEISDDRMQAWLSIDPGEGSGAKLSEKKIRDGIESAGVTKGINNEVLDKAIEAVLSGEKVERIPFAQGAEPDLGGREQLEFLLQLASNAAVTIREDGSADYRNKDNMTRVTKDQAIARITPPPKKPTPGFDVSGKEILPPGEQALNIQVSERIRQEEQEDHTVILYSTIDGELKYEKNAMDVLAVHTVQGNVDLNTGNIKFPGTVQVAGNVESGLYIMSNADIKIMGGVDRALLSAGGDILIQGGVKGGGKSLLRAKQNILASFIEQATVLAVQDIKIAKSCFRSNVKCNGKLMMGDSSTIVGGTVKVKHGLEVSNLGSERGIHTRVHFGQDYLVEDQVNVQEKEIKKIQLQIAEIDAEIQKAAKTQEKQRLAALANKKTKLIKLMQKRGVHLFNLKERFEQHFESQLIVSGSLHPGVILESHGREFEVNKEQKNVSISFDTEAGRIKIEEREKKDS